MYFTGQHVLLDKEHCDLRAAAFFIHISRQTFTSQYYTFISVYVSVNDQEHFFANCSFELDMNLHIITDHTAEQEDRGCRMGWVTAW